MKLVLKSSFAVLLLAGNCLPALAQLRSEPESSAPIGLTDPPGSASLDQLYPEPKGGAPFSSSTPDMVLTGAELDKARSISLGQINMSELLPIGRGKLPPIKLEAAYNEQLSLKQALLYALGNNLPIRISQAGYDAQRYQFLGSLGNFLPDFTLTYRGQRTDTQARYRYSFFHKFGNDSLSALFQGGGVLFNSLASMNQGKGWEKCLPR
jgi:hypothetical protein